MANSGDSDGDDRLQRSYGDRMTITRAKYKGKCRCCRAVIRPDEVIGYNGTGHIYCQKCLPFAKVRSAT